MPRRGRFRWTSVLSLLATGAVVGATAFASSEPSASSVQAPRSSPRASDAPRCFGAAALDPGRRCHNPELDKVVTPSPRAARHSPNAPCTVVGHDGAVKLCAFGAPADQAVATVALVGDSHAENWRAAVEEVASA